MSEQLGKANHDTKTDGSPDAADATQRSVGVEEVLAHLSDLRQRLFGFFVERRTRQEGEIPTRLQLHLLNRLSDRGGSTVSEIASFLGVSRPTASQLATTLAERGWVTREMERADRRRHRVVLTEEGLSLVRKRQAAREAQLRRVVAGLTVEERASLLRLSERIGALILEGDPGADPQTSSPKAAPGSKEGPLGPD